MQKLDGSLLFSAHDLIRFLHCPHCTWLDLKNLETPLAKASDDAELLLLQDKGAEHERVWLECRRAEGLKVIEIPASGSLASRVAETRAATAASPDLVYQAALHDGRWHGYADFLRRVTPTGAASPLYEPVDTKLSRTPRPDHIFQLCVYSDLLGAAQGGTPAYMHLVLGDGREIGFAFAAFADYFRQARRRFEAWTSAPPADSCPEPCAYCDLCCWRDICSEQWERDDHLSLVAGITRAQIRKLNDAGVRTVRSLGGLPAGLRIPRLGPETLERLRGQALLQLRKRDTGEDACELLPLEEGRGFARLPVPDPADVFLDFEGDPLFPDGLEYLMGQYYLQEGNPVFEPLWGHDREGERRAFERLMDSLTARCTANPSAFIYHYNHYEVTALKRIASRFGSREEELDNLLRTRRFVDLYKVVREGLRISEPSYSLKNLETFYMPRREGGVKTAAQSIVVYERWRQSQDPALLDEIARYNEADCRSTALLRDWLLKQRPGHLPWLRPDAEASSEESAERRRQAAERRETQERALKDASSGEENRVLELVSHLLEFHRREQKPQWWAMFDRQGRTDEELIDDADCLGGLRADRSLRPISEKRSLIYTFRYPPQETKLHVGDRPLLAADLEPAGEIVEMEDAAGLVHIKRALSKGGLPSALSLIPEKPLSMDVLRDAVYRFAASLASRDGRYPALLAFLHRQAPRIAGMAPGAALVDPSRDVIRECCRIVSGFSDSCLFIQGPPGSGKTYASSHIILDRILDGKRVGVASNSHKAINNLLAAVEQRALEAGVSFRGIKKSDGQRPDTRFNGEFVEDVTSADLVDPGADLIAGTAYLFAREELDQVLDYLFVDEAGQVSLANLVAMGLSARNIVLVGDQMQLAQPIQGVHPGESGLSALDYLLQGAATIDPYRGIFLATTWRMHDDVCRFISEAVYDGRLEPEPHNRLQELILRPGAHPALIPAGIRFVPVDHSGCSQKSEEEGLVIRAIYGSLMEQRFRDRHGAEHPFGPENILVVAPYNVQVNHLKAVLPEGARVGTVDKFQGQEAEAVLVSMTTSGAEELPRYLEFLYSRNRLNVAISRARSLALIVASPRLLEIPCNTVEQMQLVSVLCRAATASSSWGCGPLI